MADKFSGFLPPTENYSKLPHQMIEALPLVETVSEMKVILYILRHTWGFQDQWKKITLDEFENGRKDKKGNRMDAGIGLSIPSIRDGLKRAEEHGFILVETDDGDKARVKKFYSLAMAADEPLQSDCKTLTPTNKNLSGDVKESNSRSEKETLERNSQKETEKETAAFPEKSNKPLDDQAIIESIVHDFVNNTSPEDLQRATVAKREEAGNFAAPPSAGGDDGLADRLIAIYCRCMGEAEPEGGELVSARSTFRRVLKRKKLSQDGDVAEQGLRVILDPEGEWAFHFGNYAITNGENRAKLFETHYGKVLARLKAGGDGYSEQYRREKGAKHGPRKRGIADGAVQRQVATEEEARAILG